MVEPYAGDEFIVLVRHRSIMRIDWQSAVRWELELPFQNDLAVADNGDIYGIILEKTVKPCFFSSPALYESLVVVSPEGEVKRRISFADILAKRPKLVALVRSEETRAAAEDTLFPGVRDPLHTNTIEIIPRDVIIAGRTLFRKGNVLFCMRNIDLIGVVDIEREQLVWEWGPGILVRPHCATLLENGNLLIFANASEGRHSQVIEMNPHTREIEHSISGAATNAPFFSEGRGSCQRFPNGNTLIVPTDESRAIEVTPAGDVVWEFRSCPLESHPDKRIVLYRLPRLLDVEKSRHLREAVRTPTLDTVLREYGVAIGEIGGTRIDREFRRKGTNIGFHSLVATDGDVRVEMEIMAPLPADIAKRYLTAKYTIVRSQYGPQPHPYPGVITNLTDCPEDKKPVETQVEVLGQAVVVLLANASERFTFGVWEDDLIKHRGAFCVLYVPERNALFEVRIFQPHDRFDRDAVLKVLGSLRGIAAH